VLRCQDRSYNATQVAQQRSRIALWLRRPIYSHLLQNLLKPRNDERSMKHRCTRDHDYLGHRTRTVTECIRRFVAMRKPLTIYILLGTSRNLQPLGHFSNRAEREWIIGWSLHTSQCINRLESITSLRSNPIR
jgi:hypothetical protein